MSVSSTSKEFFETMYSADEDPWGFASSPRELARYDAIVAALATRSYRHAFEPACSVGVLTERLAQICGRVTAFDLSCTAAARAAERCAVLPNVCVRCASVTNTLPDGDVDLLVLSEVGYYFLPSEWEGIVQRMLHCCEDGCVVLAAHWLGSSPDHRATGDEAHAVLRGISMLRLEEEERRDTFRLDRFRLVKAC